MARPILLSGGSLSYPWGFESGDLLLDKFISNFDDPTHDDGHFRDLDCSGLIVAPGFIDIHVHGTHGSDVMDGSIRSLDDIARFMVLSGVTSFLGTTMSDSLSFLGSVLSVAGSYKNKQRISNPAMKGRARFIGIHMEGPFLSPLRAGAHNHDFFTDPDLNFVLDHRDTVRLITVAPERTGCLDFISRLSSEGIAVSLGHSDCPYDVALSGLAAGAKGFTHLYNAMSPMDHRYPGMVGAALDSRSWCELICDGVHLHPSAVRLACRAIGPDRIILVTDSIRARGMGNGVFELGDKRVFVNSDRACLDDGTLAGSVLSMIDAIRNVVSWGAMSLSDALNAASFNPARYLGITDAGRLVPGCVGDVVLLDEKKLSLEAVFVGGEPVFLSSDLQKAMQD